MELSKNRNGINGGREEGGGGGNVIYRLFAWLLNEELFDCGDSLLQMFHDQCYIINMIKKVPKV